MLLCRSFWQAALVLVLLSLLEVEGSSDTVHFILNPGKDQKELKPGDASSLKSLPNPSYKGLKVVIHGLAGSCNQSIYTDITNAYIKATKNYGIVCVDWAGLSFFDDPGVLLKYADAVNNTVTVGKAVAVFCQFLQESKVIPSLDTVHLVGFSLGSHVAGVAGYELGGKVGRITGLDPAGPGFKKEKSLSKRIDKTDAKYVDIIHTNAGQLGTDVISGHADYFPNGGKSQPGCTDLLTGGCSHSKAPAWFAKSILNHGFAAACPCDSWKKFESKKCSCKKKAAFGEPSKAGITGVYYFSVKG